jgi:type II secretion system protein H
MTICSTTIQVGVPGCVAPCVSHARKPKRISAHGVAHPALLASGFTLIELIVVMALLGIMLAIAAPSLSRFFKSRNLDSEARQFVALTHAAQSRAVSEGVPMVLWVDTKQHTYGLNADKSFVEQDPKAEQFTLDDSVEIEVRPSADAIAAGEASQFKNEKPDSSGRYTLRFNPDGFVSASSPEIVVFSQKDNGELWVAQSRNRLNYEIQTSKPTLASR